MSTTTKAKNSAQKSQGKIKVALGKLTGNKSLQAKGKRDQTKASVKQTVGKVKDAVKK